MAIEWTDVALAIGAVVTIVGAIFVFAGRLFRAAWKIVRKMNLFFEDFYGEPARPGVPEKKGVIERISNVEDTQSQIVQIQAEQSSLLKQIRDEQIPNHGSSLRDDINRIHLATTGHKSPTQAAYDSESVTPNQDEILESKGIK